MTLRSGTVVRPCVVLFLIIQLLFFSQFLQTSSGQDVIFDHNEIWGNGTYNIVSKSNAVAQSFVASSHYTLTKISLHVKATKVADLNVTLQTSNFGLPSGAEIGYFDATSSPPLVTHEWMDFRALSDIDIVESTEYWIVTRCSEAMPNGYLWYTSDADAYPQGMMAVDDTGVGQVWSLNSADDEMFRIWGSPLSSALYFDIVVDRETAEPGDTLRFTIFFNNTGNADSAKVWINDSLPSGLEYLSDTASSLPFYSGGYRNGGDLHYNFTDVPPGSHFFVLRVEVNESVPLGSEVTNWAYMDYTDSIGFFVSSLGDGATCRIEYHEPSITVEAVADKDEVEGQDIVTYTIYFNNTGAGTANRVWINSTIPGNVEFLTSSPPPALNDGRDIRFAFDDVAPGTHSLTLAVVIEDGLPRDTTFVNSVVLNYTNSRDIPREGSFDSVISVLVNAGSEGGEETPMSSSLIFSIVIVVGSISAGATFVVMNRRKPVIDEVFFLHRSGELIRHYTRRMKPDVDSDILSGMLVAVQDFVSDTFKFRKGELNQLKFGEYHISIIRCKSAILAAVTAGPEPKKLESQLRDVCKEIETKLGDKLKKWSGMPDELSDADEIVKKLIIDKY
ncbi:MAG: DUF11 domain-containing protein [Thermoplasmata archaeon]|nr:DUF11 domain-containing protein [Thermoplasmata archaeon]